jgi:hypothetical protein
VETNNKLFLKHKYDYLELSDKISKIRYDGDEVPMDLLLQALNAGGLAEIPDDELKNLLFNLDTQSSESNL